MKKKYIYIYIYIYLGGFPVVGMRKKKGKKKQCRSMKWATAHLSHDTMDCIVTQGWGGWAGRAAGAIIQMSMPAIQPCDTTIRGPRYIRPARMQGPGRWELGCDTKLYRG